MLGSSKRSKLKISIAFYSAEVLNASQLAVWALAPVLAALQLLALQRLQFGWNAAFRVFDFQYMLTSKMNSIQFILCLSPFLSLCLSTASPGDVVWIRGKSEPVCGVITNQSKDTIQMRVFADGKFGETESFPTSEVETSVDNIDPQRLASLTPDDPVAYRNYAEELSTQRSDAAAISLARRLYLLAATNSTANSQRDLRAGAILGLISLAPDPIQRRKLEMFYQLNEPNSRMFKLASPPLIQDAPTKSEQEMMLRVVVAIRRETPAAAVGLLRLQENRRSIKKWSEFCTLQELDRIVAADQPSKLQLSKLLAIELAVRQSGTTKSKSKSIQSSWGELAMDPANQLSVLPTTSNVTEFDPDKSVYRNGTWVRP